MQEVLKFMHPLLYGISGFSCRVSDAVWPAKHGTGSDAPGATGSSTRSRTGHHCSPETQTVLTAGASDAAALREESDGCQA